jgi:hypothetical protein
MTNTTNAKTKTKTIRRIAAIAFAGLATFGLSSSPGRGVSSSPGDRNASINMTRSKPGDGNDPIKYAVRKAGQGQQEYL